MVNIPSNSGNKKNHLPYDIQTVPDWFNYRISRKLFIIRPFYFRDVQILKQIEKDRIESQSDSANVTNTRIRVQHSFYFLLNLDVKKLIIEVGQRLNIPPEHISCHLSFHCKNSENSKSNAGAVKPLYLTYSEPDAMSMEAYIQNNLLKDNTFRGSKSKYVLYYRILPFPITSTTKRSFDLRITDVRVKYWRSEYLKYLNNLNNNSNNRKRKSIHILDSPDHNMDSQSTVTPVPIWDIDDENVFNYEEDYCVYCSYHKEVEVGNAMDGIRRSLGIPININLFTNVYQSPADNDIQRLLLRSSTGQPAVLSDIIKINNNLVCTPVFPLAIMSVRSNIIDQILFATYKIGALVSTW